MKIAPDCIPCITKMALDSARQAIGDEGDIRTFMERVLALKPLRGEQWDVVSPEIVRDVWLHLCDVAGSGDPLKALKAEQNRKALQLYPSVRQIVSQKSDPLLYAIKFAIAGNTLDPMQFTGDEMPKGLEESPLRPDDVAALTKRLSAARRLLYVTDNCGEIVFDRLLIETLRARYEVELTVMTRCVPVLNDATLQEARSVGLDGAAPLMDNGIREPFAGTSLEKASPEARALIETADLIISKGVGNYDSLTEERALRGRISFLFYGKCRPCCTTTGHDLGSLVIHNA